MAKAKNIEEQMVAYAIQRNTVIATGEIVYFVVLWLYAGRAKWYETFNLHKRLFKARKLGLNANPHLRKTNVSTSFYYELRRNKTKSNEQRN